MGRCCQASDIYLTALFCVDLTKMTLDQRLQASSRPHGTGGGVIADLSLSWRRGRNSTPLTNDRRRVEIQAQTVLLQYPSGGLLLMFLDSI